MHAGHCCNELCTGLQVVDEASSSEVVADRPVLYDPVFDEYLLARSDRVAGRAVMNCCPGAVLAYPGPSVSSGSVT
jgi:hypothetical protein